MSLSTAPGTGVLSFRSNPVGAIVIIDDVEYNNSPVTVNNIPTGSHSFILKMDGYKDFADTIEVMEDKLCCANIDLEAISSETSCNTTPIEIKEPTISAPKPDYTLLAIAFLAGIIIALIYKDNKRE